MKNMVHRALLMGLSVFTVVSFSNSEAQEQGDLYAALRSQMERACPKVWEDLGADMDTTTLNENIWGASGAADRAEFILLLEEIVTGSTADQISAMADDVATVATECASHRVALLDALISKTPRDVLLAMDAVNRGLNKSVEYLDGGWTVGDVRVTGRLQAQDGWVFLTGQTIGNANSLATLPGDDYNELFELAKNWAPNSGSEDWAAGDLVTLPDMRGRALVAADNMGGSSADTVTEIGADRVGGTFGSESRVLSSEQLPTHKHTIGAAGSHGHTVNYAGSHKHNMTNVRSYVYVNPTGAASSYRSPWLRSGADMKTASSGNHNHTLSTAPNHTHTVNDAGGSQPVKMTPPSIIFNVEMKY